MIAFRLLCIASRRYSAEPATRPEAVRMMLRNVLRLARAHLGDKETAQISIKTLGEDRRAA